MKPNWPSSGSVVRNATDGMGWEMLSGHFMPHTIVFLDTMVYLV